MEELKKRLEALANKKAYIDDEDFNAYDAGGGQYDEAFNCGVNDGEILLARDLLKRFFPN